MKLSDVFHRPQLTSLLGESDTQLTLGLLDPETGEVRQVVVSADMAVLSDEAVLSVEVRDEHDNSDLARWWVKDDSYNDDDEPAGYNPSWNEVASETDPSPLWSITPSGTEFDLRDTKLF